MWEKEGQKKEHNGTCEEKGERKKEKMNYRSALVLLSLSFGIKS